jgi:hypothetical protein
MPNQAVPISLPAIRLTGAGKGVNGADSGRFVRGLNRGAARAHQPLDWVQVKVINGVLSDSRWRPDLVGLHDGEFAVQKGTGTNAARGNARRRGDVCPNSGRTPADPVDDSAGAKARADRSDDFSEPANPEHTQAKSDDCGGKLQPRKCDCLRRVCPEGIGCDRSPGVATGLCASWSRAPIEFVAASASEWTKHALAGAPAP